MTFRTRRTDLPGLIESIVREARGVLDRLRA